jgi:hypothetical protein
MWPCSDSSMEHFGTLAYPILWHSKDNSPGYFSHGLHPGPRWTIQGNPKGLMLTRDMTRLGKHGKAMESIPNLGELWVTKNQLVGMVRGWLSKF